MINLEEHCVNCLIKHNARNTLTDCESCTLNTALDTQDDLDRYDLDDMEAAIEEHAMHELGILDY